MPIVGKAWLRSSVYAKLGDSSGFYTEEDVDRAILGAISELNAITGFNRSHATLSLTPGKSVYETPYPIEVAVAVEVSGRRIPRSSPESLFSHSRLWGVDVAPLPSVWCPIGFSKILFSPPFSVPLSARVEGIASFGMSLGDHVNIPSGLVPMVVELAWHRLVMREGGAVFYDASESMGRISKTLYELSVWKTAKLTRYRHFAIVSAKN